MKKSLLALAVLGAFTSAASAQSSVTLFGIVDVNLTYIDNDIGSQYSMGSDGMNSSRLGFRGVEDLGGGLTASFWLEGGMSPDNGTASGQNWRRRSTVSLAGGWGEVRLGRDYTSTFWNMTIFDPFGTNGIGAASNLALIAGACGGTAPAGTTCANLPGGTSISDYGTGVRANNMVAYFLPSGIAGGLYGQVQVAAGEGAPGNKYFGGRLGYAAGPFNIAGSYGRTQVTVSGQAATPARPAIPPVPGVTPGFPAVPATPFVPADQRGTSYNFGASWNFGFMQLSGYWGSQEIEKGEQDNWFIGAQAPMGQWTFKATYGQLSRNGSVFGVNVDDDSASQFALGATYDLSKRTALYGTYSGIKNDGGARMIVGAISGQAFGGGAPDANSQGFQMGVRHSF